MGIIRAQIEQRSAPDTSGMLNPKNWLLEALNYWKTSTGIRITHESAMRATAVFGCIRIISETESVMPLVLYRRVGNDGKERAYEHPLYQLLHVMPNEEMSSVTFRRTLTGHLAARGNAYAEIKWSGAGHVESLWPIPPDRIRPERTLDKWRKYYRVWLPNGQEVQLLPYQVFHIVGFSGTGDTGYSPVELHKDAIGLALAKEKYDALFYRNDATPSTIITHPGELSDDAYDRLEKHFKENHAGIDKKYNLEILEEGMKVERIGLTHEDAQFLETRRYQVEEIARIWRMPMHMLQELSRATFSNIEHQDIQFNKHCMSPYLVDWESTVLIKLLTPQERSVFFAEHVVEALLRGDTPTRYQAYQTAVDGGWMKINDVRRRENLDPVPAEEGGEVLWRPMNYMPSGAFMDFVEPASQPAARAHGVVEARAKRKSPAARIRVMKSYRRVFEDAAGRIVRREVNDISAAAKKYLGKRSSSLFADWLEEYYRGFPKVVQKNLAPGFSSLAEAVHDAAAAEVGIDPDFQIEVDSAIGKHLEGVADRYVGSSQGQVRKLLNSAETEEDFLGDLDARLGEWEDKRPGKLAGWEIIRCGSLVAAVVFARAGFSGLTWVASDKACPFCSELAGTTVSNGESFASGPLEVEGAGSLTPAWGLPTPPLHEGCECNVVPA